MSSAIGFMFKGDRHLRYRLGRSTDAYSGRVIVAVLGVVSPSSETLSASIGRVGSGDIA